MSITIILLIIALVVIIAGLVYTLIAEKKRYKETITQLNKDIACQQNNIIQLKQFFEKVFALKKEEKDFEKRIENAKSEEDYNNIIADIIARNNDRVRDDKSAN
jgi:Tfp pilus assembly protein PilN